MSRDGQWSFTTSSLPAQSVPNQLLSRAEIEFLINDSLRWRRVRQSDRLEVVKRSVRVRWHQVSLVLLHLSTFDFHAIMYQSISNSTVAPWMECLMKLTPWHCQTNSTSHLISGSSGYISCYRWSHPEINTIQLWEVDRRGKCKHEATDEYKQPQARQKHGAVFSTICNKKKSWISLFSVSFYVRWLSLIHQSTSTVSPFTCGLDKVSFAWKAQKQ